MNPNVDLQLKENMHLGFLSSWLKLNIVKTRVAEGRVFILEIRMIKTVLVNAKTWLWT